MATLNRVTLIGRLTDNPEPPRTLPNTGNRVVKFRFAVGRSKKNPQTGQWENDPNPLYIDCEAFTRDNFTRLVDVVTNYCRKGSQILIEGQLRYDTWVDKTTNEKRSKHKIVIDNIELLDTRPHDGGGGDAGPGDEDGGNYQRSAPPARSAPAGGGRSAPPPRNNNEDDRSGGGSPEEIPF